MILVLGHAPTHTMEGDLLLYRHLYGVMTGLEAHCIGTV